METKNEGRENKNEITGDLSIFRSSYSSDLLYSPPSPPLLSTPLSPSYSPSLNWEVVSKEPCSAETIENTRVSASRRITKRLVKDENLPLFFKQGDIIKVPKTVEAKLRSSETPKALLKKVNSKKAVAIEMCLLFLSHLDSWDQDNNENEGWKFIGARYWRRLFNDDPNTYLHIINLLKYPYVSGDIIETGYGDNIGIKAHKFRYTEFYRSKKMVNRVLQSEYVNQLSKKSLIESYHRGTNNIIIENLNRLYPIITLPTIEEINERASRAKYEDIDSKKKLVYLNKHSRDYYKNKEEISFVEDAIKVFRNVTENGFIIPREGGEYSGGRVFDSLNRLPKWIRKMIKIDGEPIVECDYTCFHPNLAIRLYGGSQQYLTHEMIAEKTGIYEDVVKTEHLSFFNAEVWQMKGSRLYSFYEKHEPNMLKRIIRDKLKSGHRETTKKMFSIEVEIMKKVISELNKEGIVVTYIFDALGCKYQHQERVKEIMNKIALEFGVYTTAKSDEDKASKKRMLQN